MKTRITQKAVRERTTNIICVGYCALQLLLRYEQPTWYTTRTEGWAADVYTFGSTAIATGYAPFGNIRPSYELVQLYEQKASTIDESLSDYNQRKAALHDLIYDFIEEATS